MDVERQERSLRGWWRRLVPDRGTRKRRVLRRLVTCVVVVGLAFGGWGLWRYHQASDRRKQVSRACGGVVDPATVLSLDGGADHIGTDDLVDDGPLRPTATFSDCDVSRVDGKGDAHDYFYLTVWRQPSDTYVGLDPDSETPFGSSPSYDKLSLHAIRAGENRSTLTAKHSADHPLGDGRLGYYDDESVTVTARCAPRHGQRATSVDARAEGAYGHVSTDDRRKLATLARDAARHTAEKLGCAAHFAPVPDRLSDPRRKLADASSAGGTCAWYGRWRRSAGDDTSPDRALGAPTADHAVREGCVLALSLGAFERAWPHLTAAQHSKHIDESSAEFVMVGWLETRSFFGDDARTLRVDAHEPLLRPGTSGDSSVTPLVWASSVCAGQPAMHTLTMENMYGRILQKQLRALFRAYVDDVTQRRHCTDVKFPTHMTW